jgi:hypothetical protein
VISACLDRAAKYIVVANRGVWCIFALMARSAR